MKQFGQFTSIKNNSSELYSSTYCDWRRIKPGSAFKIDNIQQLLMIESVRPFFIIKDFKTINRNILEINGDVFPYIFQDDLAEITYKEYTLESFDTPFSNGGTGYAVGDLLFADIGVLSPDSLGDDLTLKVEKVDTLGSILKTSVLKYGKYLEPPVNHLGLTTFATNGSGNNFRVLCSFKETDNRPRFDKRILSINTVDGITKLTLAGGMPDNIKTGKLSVKKWVAQLSAPFYDPRGDVNSKTYKVFVDFTPFLKMPYLLPNSGNLENIINKNFQIIDEAIKSINDRLDKK